jgi:hypothetical protein
MGDVRRGEERQDSVGLKFADGCFKDPISLVDWARKDDGAAAAFGPSHGGCKFGLVVCLSSEGMQC